MNDNYPYFSIIIPVYNEGERLIRAVDSALNQTFRNIQVIIVDDGSSDRTTLAVLDGYKTDQRVNVIHKQNGGVSSARNCGLNVADGEYIIFLDGDDWLESDTCEKYRQMIADDYVDVLVSNYYIDNELIGKTDKTNYIKKGDRYIGKSEEALQNVYKETLYNNRGCFRKELSSKNCLRMREDLLISEDLDYSIRLLLASYRIVTTEYAGYHYCVYGKHDRLSLQRFKSQIKASNEWIICLQDKKYDDGLRKHISRLFADIMCVYILRIIEIPNEEAEDAIAYCKPVLSVLCDGSLGSRLFYIFARIFGLKMAIKILGNIYIIRYRKVAN